MRVITSLVTILIVFSVALTDDKSDISTLIMQLGADTQAARDKASAALEKLGPSVLPELRRALRSDDAEIRRRAKRLIETIEASIFGERQVFEARAGSVNAVAFTTDGKRALSGDSRAVRLWDLVRGKEVARSEDHRDRVMAVACSPDGKLIATGSEDRTVRLWNATRLTEIRQFKRHKAEVRAVSFSADGKKLISAGFDGLVQEWEIATGSPRRQASIMHGRLFQIGLLADGHRVLVTVNNNNDVPCIDLRGSGIPIRLSGHSGHTLAVCVSRDGKRALTGSHDRLLRLWDLATGKCLQTLKGHTAEISAVALSPDGKSAISGGHDHVLRVWELESGRHVREMRGHDQAIWSVAISPDGKQALSGSQDGTMRLWAIGR